MNTSATPLLDRNVIAQLLPHQGKMCLIDQVTSWSEQMICCETATHRDEDNPLRGVNGLGAVNAIEYAAQAMALHAGLHARGVRPEGHGVLASARAVRLHVDRLDQLQTKLKIEAELISGDPQTALYGFSISADGMPVASGRLSVLFQFS